VPRWFLGTLLLPEHATTPELVRAIYDQLKSACAKYGVLLVGGHTEVTYGLDRPLFSGALVGEVSKEDLVTGRGVQPGDAILLTKAVAIEGTSIIAREKRDALLAAGFEAGFLDACANMLHDPGIGVLAEARAACGAARVHAMHDPTEGGLATGLWELALAGGVGLRVDGDAIPVHEATRRLCGHFGLDAFGLIASGSLLVACAPQDAEAIAAGCRDICVPCTVIGHATHEDDGCVVFRDGREQPLLRFDQDEIGRIFS